MKEPILEALSQRLKEHESRVKLDSIFNCSPYNLFEATCSRIAAEECREIIGMIGAYFTRQAQHPK